MKVKRTKLMALANLREELTEKNTKLSEENVFLIKKLDYRKVREEELQAQICKLEGDLDC